MGIASIWTGLGLRTSGPDHRAPWSDENDMLARSENEPAQELVEDYSVIGRLRMPICWSTAVIIRARNVADIHSFKIRQGYLRAVNLDALRL